LTLPDDSLTLRDMTVVVRAAALRGFAALVKRLGGDAGALLRRHHLSRASLDDEETLIPLRALISLLEDSARSLNCPDLGLQLAMAQDVSILGPLAVALQHSPSVGEALALSSRYLFLHSNGIAFTIVLEDPPGPGLAQLRFEIALSESMPARQAFDLGLAVSHRMFGMLVGDAYRLKAVHLPHTPVAPRSTYRSFFAAPVRFDQPHAALVVPRALFEAPLPASNETLRLLATSFLDAHYAVPGASVGPRVRLALTRSLGAVPCGIEPIAAALAMHPRTLQRHLASEGTSFDELRDEVTRQAALRYIGSTDMPLGQVAALLGLSEQSALSRSCRRWFGESPSAMRRRIRTANA